jgi:hypothetical protein
MRIKGKITAWFPRGFGYIQAKTRTQVSRYFLHIGRVVALHGDLEEPVVGCVVVFEPTNNLKRNFKDLPSAIDVEVYPPTPDLTAEVLVQMLAGEKAGV